jgi:hypothetical protein
LEVIGPMKRFIALLLPSIVIMVALAGCYTILQHPAVDESYSSHDYQQDCVRCHADYHQYPYGYFYGSYPGYWWDNPRWGHYYAYPWWWDNYWYSNDYDQNNNDGDDSNTPRTEESQKAIRRDALRPPYVSGSSTASFHRQETTTGTGTVDGKTNPADNSTDSTKKDDDNKSDSKKETKKEEKKAERRGGKDRR